MMKPESHDCQSPMSESTTDTNSGPDQSSAMQTPACGIQISVGWQDEGHTSDEKGFLGRCRGDDLAPHCDNFN